MFEIVSLLSLIHSFISCWSCQKVLRLFVSCVYRWPVPVTDWLSVIYLYDTFNSQIFLNSHPVITTTWVIVNGVCSCIPNGLYHPTKELFLKRKIIFSTIMKICFLRNFLSAVFEIMAIFKMAPCYQIK